MKTTFGSILCIAVLPLLLSSCGADLKAASATSCGGGSMARAATEGSPAGTSSSSFDGAYDSHVLHVDLASDGKHAQLVVDGGQPLDLSIVARIYRSDGLGVFGDATTRADSKVLVILSRTEANERSIKVTRWQL